VGPLVDDARLPRDPRLLLAVIYLALFATLFAFGVQVWAQRRVAPVRIALLSSLEPLFAAGFAALLLGERLQRREWVGGASIVAGVLVGEVGSALASRGKPLSADAPAASNPPIERRW
jgi:drug/metabolite transporter (DMT)-like permease